MPKAGKGETRLRKLCNFKRWDKRMRSAAQKAFDAEQTSVLTLRPRERADNVYRLMAYGYYRELKGAGLIDQLRQYVVERDGSQWKRHRQSEELWVLRLTAQGEQTDRMRKKRDRWAAELKLADLNDVRPDLLLGFLYEAGATELIEEDAKAEVRYPWAECYRNIPAPKRPREARRPKVMEFDEDEEWLPMPSPW